MSRQSWFSSLLVIVVGASTPILALEFEDRVKAQLAIERVRHAHRIEAQEGFERAVPISVIHDQVRAYLSRSEELAALRGTTVSAEELREERKRIESTTRMPGRLAELYAALNGDSDLIEECLVRPVLVERLLRAQSSLVPTPLDSSVTGRLAVAGTPLCPGDSWAPISMVGAPGPRRDHAAVWTGNLMLIWGGGGFYGARYEDGARYDPSLDSWTPMNENEDLSYRLNAQSIWTGTEWLLWGGSCEGGRCRDGYLYDPVADTWRRMSPIEPIPVGSTAIWTGTQILLWGGRAYFEGPDIPWCHPPSDELWSYDPQTDTWVELVGPAAPSPRDGSSAVWTGSEMIVWGGQDRILQDSGTCSKPTFNDGGRYDPVANTWTPITGPLSPRTGYETVWTGHEMILWGGRSGSIHNDGARYDPVSDSWIEMSQVGAPPGGTTFVGVLAGGRLLLWGEAWPPTAAPNDDGARYDPSTDSWTEMNPRYAPEPRSEHTIVSDGTVMMVWGGRRVDSSQTFGDGALYNPVEDDMDQDSICGDVDNCPFIPNELQEDLDDDGIGDPCDSCPEIPNPDGLRVTFDQQIIAQSHDEFTWSVAEDVVWAVVELAGLPVYDVAASEADPAASSIDASSWVPTAGGVYYFLVRLGGTCYGSWQTTVGVEPGRDDSLP